MLLNKLSPAEPLAWICPVHHHCCVCGAAKLGGGRPGLCSNHVSFKYCFKGYLLRLHIVNDLGSLVFMLKVSQFSMYAVNISLKPCHFPQVVWFQNNSSVAQVQLKKKKKAVFVFPLFEIIVNECLSAKDYTSLAVY